MPMRMASSSAYTYRIASVAALGGLLFGFDTAIINGAIVFLKLQFGWTEFQTEIAASSLLLGCILGASIAGWLSDRYGRRSVLFLSAAIFAISSLLTALAHNLVQFSSARIAAGTAIGIASMLAPLYIAEISPEAIRGRLVSLNQLAIMLGILASYLAGWALSSLGGESWRWMFASCIFPSLLFLAALLAVPESPRWLIKMGHDLRAATVLERLGEPASRVEAVKVSLAEESSGSLLRRGLYKPLLIGVALAVLQQVTGINTILYYGSIIFTEQVGTKSTSAALWANVVVGLVNLVCTIAALLVIDRLGRKALLILSSGGMGVSLFILGGLFLAHSSSSSLILILILCYVGCFSLGMGPGVWVVISELFPTRVRGRAMSVATISLWVACFAVTLSFLSVVRAISIAWAFWVYAILCVSTVLFVWLAVPETKRQTLEAIEQQWAV